MFKLGFAISLNLDKEEMETALTWGVRHKASSTSTIPGTKDGQTKMPL